MFTEPSLKHVERRDAEQRMMKWQKEVECAQSSSLEMNRNEEYAWMKRYEEAAEWLLAVGIRYRSQREEKQDLHITLGKQWHDNNKSAGEKPGRAVHMGQVKKDVINTGGGAGVWWYSKSLTGLLKYW